MIAQVIDVSQLAPLRPEVQKGLEARYRLHSKVISTKSPVSCAAASPIQFIGQPQINRVAWQRPVPAPRSECPPLAHTGDEKDYILDYKRRFSTFPHETTGDQFFSEEQFEMYRALGFRMVDGFFSRKDDFSFIGGAEGFADQDSAFQSIDLAVPRCS